MSLINTMILPIMIQDQNQIKVFALNQPKNLSNINK